MHMSRLCQCSCLCLSQFELMRVSVCVCRPSVGEIHPRTVQHQLLNLKGERRLSLSLTLSLFSLFLSFSKHPTTAEYDSSSPHFFSPLAFYILFLSSHPFFPFLPPFFYPPSLIYFLPHLTLSSFSNPLSPIHPLLRLPHTAPLPVALICINGITATAIAR